MRALLVLVLLVSVAASAQDGPTSRGVEDDVSCISTALHPYDVVWMGGYLRGLHTAGALDLERLVQTPIGPIDEISPSLLLGAVLLAMKDAAPDLVAGVMTGRSFPKDPGEQARFVQSLIDTFVGAEIDLSDRPIPEESDESIEVYEISTE